MASVALMALGATAADYLWFNQGGVANGLLQSQFNSITLSDDGQSVVVSTKSGATYNVARASLTDVTPGAYSSEEVLIKYTADGVEVTNPYAFAGVTITTDGGHVTVNADTTDEIVYRLTGTTTDGSFKIYSNYKFEAQLDGVNITNPNGAAINSQTGKKMTLRVVKGTTNYLADGSKYTNTPSGEDEKGTLFSEGQIEFRAGGTLHVTGNYKHAICVDDYVQLRNSNVIVDYAKSDALHVNDYFQMESGSFTANNMGGDGVDADDEGYIDIQGGEIQLTVSGDTNKGLKTGTGALTITGGTITIATTGGVEVSNYEPSYTTAIKAKSTLSMSGGTINITGTGEANKGISVEGDATFTGGNVTISEAGKGATYTLADKTTDAYSSTCISVGGDLNMLDGTFNLSTASTASCGKCIKVDGAGTFGTADASCGLDITASTAGSRLSITSNSGTSTGPGGWGGGNWGGGRPDDNGGYSNPKVIKTMGNLTVNGGHLSLKGTTEGGEGLESKATLFINGGVVETNTYDDGLNAASHIAISGGQVYCYSSNNDGIDSNGTITISGGEIVALGNTGAECGIDCDNNSNFTVTGGTYVAIGGDYYTPSKSGTTQYVGRLSTSVNTSTTYTMVDSKGNVLLSFTSPRAYSGNVNLTFTAPSLTTSKSSVKVYTGATLSGQSEAFHGLTTGGTYSGGTLKSTVTTN